MSTAVVLTPDDSRVIGAYDGYGRVGESFDMGELDGKFSVYHKACWVLAGKPEYTVPSEGSYDQGMCHPMHGQPFPLPTKEWIALAKGWAPVDYFLSKYGRFRAKLRQKETEALYDALAPERQQALCSEFVASRNERLARYKAEYAAYMRSDDERERPERAADPETYTFDGHLFHFGWLDYLISADKQRSWFYRKGFDTSAVLEP